jgi:hypothetical protein
VGGTVPAGLAGLRAFSALRRFFSSFSFLSFASSSSSALVFAHLEPGLADIGGGVFKSLLGIGVDEVARRKESRTTSDVQSVPLYRVRGRIDKLVVAQWVC